VVLPERLDEHGALSDESLQHVVVAVGTLQEVLHDVAVQAGREVVDELHHDVVFGGHAVARHDLLEKPEVGDVERCSAGAQTLERLLVLVGVGVDVLDERDTERRVPHDLLGVALDDTIEVRTGHDDDALGDRVIPMLEDGFDLTVEVSPVVRCRDCHGNIPSTEVRARIAQNIL
jgi:hypothetical protein